MVFTIIDAVLFILYKGLPFLLISIWPGSMKALNLSTITVHSRLLFFSIHQDITRDGQNAKFLIYNAHYAHYAHYAQYAHYAHYTHYAALHNI